jgi:hypothetical protein
MAMWLKSMSTGRRNAGINIVEVIVTAFIASFFVVALVSLYVYGIQIYKQSVTLNMMYSDSIGLFHRIGKYFRMADAISLLDPIGENDRIVLHIPSPGGSSLTGGDITLYYDSHSRTLRMDDGRPDSSQFNVKLLPPIYVSGRRRNQTYAYNVKSVVFEEARDLIPNPTLDSYKLVRMRMVLEDPNEGDTLALQFSAVNRNTPQG